MLIAPIARALVANAVRLLPTAEVSRPQRLRPLLRLLAPSDCSLPFLRLSQSGSSSSGAVDLRRLPRRSRRARSCSLAWPFGALSQFRQLQVALGELALPADHGERGLGRVGRADALCVLHGVEGRAPRPRVRVLLEPCPDLRLDRLHDGPVHLLAEGQVSADSQRVALGRAEGVHEVPLDRVGKLEPRGLRPDLESGEELRADICSPGVARDLDGGVLEGPQCRVDGSLDDLLVLLREVELSRQTLRRNSRRRLRVIEPPEVLLAVNAPFSLCS
mmetsp:Transcript_11921/g.28297  ORF Transcript_11921/g.28297 Transcript_11921/m.28297 type:complete len:275 (+) Transcript_11921:698-1522(+)